MIAAGPLMPPATLSTVLLVEDEPVIRLTFQEFLEEEGLNVIACGGYDAALQALASDAVDVVISDILLGDRTGIELLREIERRELACEVIVMTGDPRMESAAEAVRLGAFDYLVKPVSEVELKRVVRLALNRHRIAAERDGYRNQLEALFNSVEAGIFMVDSELLLHHVNASARELLGLAKDDRNARLTELALADLEPLREACAAALDSGRASREIRLETRRAGGRAEGRSARMLVANVAPLDARGRGRGGAGAVVVLRDITRLTHLEQEVERQQRFHSLVGGSTAMQAIYRLIDDLSHAESTVLICGESGTGKELVAEAIHRSSVRAALPLVRVNCSALAEELLESELFGHVRGAFTGAIKDRQGRFETANGGTLFLDEIGDISPRLQLRLLRALQQGEFERVGDSRTIKVDVRIIAATNQDLLARIEAGKFREDLYYRLNVIRIDVPPLRERPSDIPLLIEHFLRHFNTKFRKEIGGVSPEAVALLTAHPWRGNVRELENCIERAFIVCHDSEIRPEHLPADVLAGAREPRPSVQAAASAPPPVGAITREAIVSALATSGWNVAKASRRLGVARNTVYEKMKRFDIQRPAGS